MDKDINAPLVSVIMPAYNVSGYIQEAINSVIAQTFSNWELILIDDGSTDSTAKIIAENGTREQRIKSFFLQKVKQSKARNVGISKASGKYIAILDSDDIIFSERFAKQVAFMEANPEVVLCGSWYKIMGSDSIIKVPENHDVIKLELLKRNCIAHSSVMMRKAVLDTLPFVYDESKLPVEDYELYVRLASKGKLHNLQEVLLDYRQHTNQVSFQRAEEQKQRVIEIKFEILNLLKIKWDAQEYEVLEKIFKANSLIPFSEIPTFKQIQKKLFIANNNLHFFEGIGFKQYLSELEYIVLKKCFYRQKRHSPLMYLEYVKAKLQWNVQLSTELEIKLLIKSILFRKVTKM